VKLADLMQETDIQKILNKAKYSPKKKVGLFSAHSIFLDLMRSIQAESLQSDIHRRMRRNLYKRRDRFYKYRPRKLLQRDTHLYMFRKRCNRY
jgi:hypothetical protein